MIVVTGSVTARQETFEEARRLSLEHVHRSRTEPGCISHAVHIDCENPLRLVFIEQWADRAALAAHFAVPASRNFVRALAPRCRGRHDSRSMTPRSSNGCEMTKCIAGLPHEIHIAMQHHTSLGIPVKSRPAMSEDWNTKYGPRRVRRDPPTLEEAIFAAVGITDDQEQQAEIASALMGCRTTRFSPR